MNKEKGVIPGVSRKVMMKDDMWMDDSKYQEPSGRAKGRHSVGGAGLAASGARDRPSYTSLSSGLYDIFFMC